MNPEIVKLREVVTKLVPLLTGKGLHVTQRGSKAYVDIDLTTRRPKSVNIPNIPDTATPEFVRAIGGFIDHEVGHVLFSDYGVFGAEIRNERDAEDPKKKGLHDLHNLVEDTLVEREIVKVFPGSKRNLADLRDHFLRKVTSPALQAAKSEQEEFSYLMVTTIRALAGQPEFEQFMSDGKHWDHPLVKKLVDSFDADTLKMFKDARNSTETLSVARTIFDLIYQDPPESGAGGDGESDDDAGGSGTGVDTGSATGKSKADKSDGEKSEGGASGGSSSESKSEDEDEKEEGEGSAGGKSEDKDEGADEDEDEKSSESDAQDDGDEGEESDAGEKNSDENDDKPEGPQDSTADATFTNEFEESQGGEGGGIGSSDTTASMFDLQHNAFEDKDLGSEIAAEISETAHELMDKRKTWTAFTREFDVIEPLSPSRLDDSWVPKMEEETAMLTSRMQKDIERMLASSNWAVHTPGHRKGKLHTPSLYKMNLNAGEDRVFKQRQEYRSTNTAVTLLVDNSGSMHGRKCHLAMIASYALSTTLDRVKVNHEVIGFTTGHYSHSAALNAALQREYENERNRINYDRTIPLVMPIYKAFGERITPEVKRRFAYTANAQAGLAGNIDGESLQIAAERLDRQPEKRKVILVLSDGQPAGGINSGPHLKSVVHDLNARGVETIGIGILDDAVRLYYDKHIVLGNVAELPGQVMTELRKILTK